MNTHFSQFFIFSNIINIKCLNANFVNTKVIENQI